MKKPGLTKLDEQKMLKRLHKQDYKKLYLIFTEGTKTEPYYFEGFKAAIEKSGRQDILIEIVGVGEATTRLLPFAEEFVEKYSIEKAEIWLVTDKDDFPDSQFNTLIQQCEKRNKQVAYQNYWHCAWSNECFELWFILHFSFYQAAVSRQEYFRMLKEIFIKRKIGVYQKNNPRIFSLLCEYGDPRLAIFYAQKLEEEKKNCLPSKAIPCTTVYQLVKELARYLPDSLKSKFF